MQVSAPPPDTPPPPVPTSYSRQWLVAGDINETSFLYAYAIDNTTGALTALPWSPAPTLRWVEVIASDPWGRFMYVGTESYLTDGAGRGVEVYGLGDMSAAPTRVADQQQFGWTMSLSFDPSGRHMYLIDLAGLGRDGSTIRLTEQRSDGLLSDLAAPFGTPSRVATGLGYKHNGTLLLASSSRPGATTADYGNVLVFRRDTKTGNLSQLSSSPELPGVAYMDVPSQGRFFLTFYCVGETPGGQMFSVDSDGSLRALPSGFYPGICSAKFDRSGRYVVARMLRDPTDQFSPKNILVLFSVSDSGVLSEVDRHEFRGEALPETLARLTFDLNGRFLYVSTVYRRIYVFSLDATAGRLIPIPGSPFDTPPTLSPMAVIGQP